MKKSTSIDIHIPVPWAREPMVISARGIQAVVIVAAAAIVITLILSY